MQAPVRTIGLDIANGTSHWWKNLGGKSVVLFVGDVRHDPKDQYVTPGRPPAPSHGDAPLSPNGASHFDRANGCEAPQGRYLNS
jgi:hypothetical protein